jgi:hypothetical protein
MMEVDCVPLPLPGGPNKIRLNINRCGRFEV